MEVLASAMKTQTGKIAAKFGCMQLCPASKVCKQFAHVVWLLTGAELLIAENQSWCELDHHGC